MIMKKVKSIYNCVYARIRFHLYGVSPRKMRKGVNTPGIFYTSLDDCLLCEALEVITAFCVVNGWQLLCYDCFEKPIERGFRL